MKKEGYYSSGQFAKMAKVTLRTIRYYDKQNLLKPSFVNENGARFYTDEDLVRLQQILLFKYLGFSLSEIKEMTLDQPDRHFLLDSLDIQLKLVKDRMEQMQLVEQTIASTAATIRQKKQVDWHQMMELIHLTNMEKSLKNQYLDASNITARIRLHELYSTNKQGWFPWLLEQYRLKPNMKVLEIGCGDGTLWASNKMKLPQGLSLTLTDISEGMLRDARRKLSPLDNIEISYSVVDAGQLPFEKNTFDLVIANHVLFYLDDLSKVFQEICCVLKKKGKLIASTYGEKHMSEVSKLVSDFDSRIILSADKLYHRFGKENGASLLAPYFSDCCWTSYEDSLLVTETAPLISYILSCHGNQNQYLPDRYGDFAAYVGKKVAKGFPITKDAGVFTAANPKLG